MTARNVRLVASFDELLSTPFTAEVNALCWTRTLDGDFEFLGNSTSGMYVYADGYIELEGGYLDPFWTDYYVTGNSLDAVTVCVKTESDKVTIQWNGSINGDGPAAQFQVVLHDDGTFDYIYGPGQDSSSAEAIIGVEGGEGFIRTISDFESGFTDPGTSYTFSYNAPP